MSKKDFLNPTTESYTKEAQSFTKRLLLSTNRIGTFSFRRRRGMRVFLAILCATLQLCGACIQESIWSGRQQFSNWSTTEIKLSLIGI